MARRGRGKGLEPRIPTKPAAPVKQAVAPVPAFVMPGTTPDLTSIDLSNIQIPNLPVAAPPVAVAPPPPPVAPAPAPVPIPQIDPAVLAQIQQQFNIPAPAPAPVKPAPAPAPAPVKEVAPPPPPPVQVAPPRIEEPPKAPPPVQVPPPQEFMPEPLPPVQVKEPPPAPIPAPVAPPPPPPPPPPAAVAPPPPPPPVQPQVPPAIPQIDPEILAQIQQEFNIPAAPPAPPVAPPVQVPPPVMQPAPPPPAAVAPPPPPVQVPPPTFVDEFEEPLAMDGMRGGPRSGIGSLPEAPPEAVVPPPVQVPPPVVQPTPSNGTVNDIMQMAVGNLDPDMQYDGNGDGRITSRDALIFQQSGLAEVPPPVAQVEPVAPPVVKPEAVVPPPVTPTVDPSLYSDPELGRGVEPGFGGTRGVSPMSPREQMGSNYVEPRDGPGQVPPGQTVDISEPTGIETMAETVGQGDYLGNTADTTNAIQLPDGSTFDLGSLDLSGIGQDLGGFELGNVNLGGVDPSLYSDPDLGGGTRGEPLPDTRGGEPAFDPFAGVTSGLGPGGYGPEGGGFSPETEPAFNPPQGAVDEVGGANFTPEFAADPGLDFSNLDLSGLNLNLGDGFDANGFEPDFTFGGPQGGPGMGNGPGNNMGNQGNQGGDPYNPTVNDTDNPYPFIPDGVNIDGMTPETLAGLNNFYEMYPNGFDYSGIDLTGIGGSFPGGFMGGSTGGTGTDDGSYTVDPVDPVGDLGVGDDTGDASDPIDVTTPYVVPDVRSASSFGLTGATQTMPVSANPFRRPESQQGLGSLAGGG